MMKRQPRRPPSPAKKQQSHSSPPSPSSSSSEFEFRVSISPRKASSSLCPADELFYKGQLLPLQLSPRLSLVRTLCYSESSSSSSSSSSASNARDSTGSSSSTDSFSLLPHAPPQHQCSGSSRPSSVTDDDLFRLTPKKNPKSSALSRFSSVFKKDSKNVIPSSSSAASGAGSTTNPSPVKRMSSTAREVIRKYVKKVKPLYEKLSQKQQQQQQGLKLKTEQSLKDNDLPRKRDSGGCGSAVSISGGLSMTYSSNLRRGRSAASCPSSMRSSPSHSGLLSRNGFPVAESCSGGGSSMSSMEDLQSAIQGAIAHCKNSMLQKNDNSLVSLEI